MSFPAIDTNPNECRHLSLRVHPLPFAPRAIWVPLLFVVMGLLIPLPVFCQQGDTPESTKAPKGISVRKNPSKRAGKKPVKLPGLVVDFDKRCVDLEATICLEKGSLELIACVKGSKEHESIFAVSARPLHIHTALLLLGSRNGHPAIRKQMGDEGSKRWVDLPPRGDPVRVSVVVPNADKKSIEKPVEQFVEFAGGQRDHDNRELKATPNSGESKKTKQFPGMFLFAGSQLQESGKGPRLYLAEKSGHVISISTFGDEILCLSEINSHQNGSLLWRIQPGQLPPVGTQVILRLRPGLQKPSNPKEATGKRRSR